jgi:hypothetical protein
MSNVRILLSKRNHGIFCTKSKYLVTVAIWKLIGAFLFSPFPFYTLLMISSKVIMHASFIHFRKPRWRLGNKELSQLWKWAEQNPVCTSSHYSAYLVLKLHKFISLAIDISLRPLILKDRDL